MFVLARQADPEIRSRGAGECAIIDWLAEKVQSIDVTDRAAIVIYENARVPRVVANQGKGTDIKVITTRAFLQLAAKQDSKPVAIDD